MKDSAKQSLQIVAKLFLLQGIFGIVAMIISLLNGKVDIRLDIVCLFLGYGLLGCSEFGRRKALAFTVFEIISFPIFAGLMLFAPQLILFFGKNDGRLEPFLLLLGIFWYIIVLWQYKILSNPLIQEICH